MRIELLGTGGYFANDRRHTACTLFPELGLAIDAGSALYRVTGHLETRELNLFLTHAHLDHIVGLPYLLLPLIQNQLTQVTIHATESTHEAISQHLFAKTLFPVEVPFHRVILPPQGRFELSINSTIEWQELPSHPGGSIAFKIQQRQHDGTTQKVAMITDTTVDGSYLDFIAEADLLIHECNFRDDQAEIAHVTGHSHSTSVANLALQAKVGQLILVHFDPTTADDSQIELSTIQSIFPSAQIGFDGMIIQL